MIRVCLLGSGSSGNSIFVGDENSGVLLDAGFSAKETAARLKTANINPSHIKGIVVSHEHGDHSRGVGVAARKLNIPVMINEPTYKRIQKSAGRLPEVRLFNTGDSFEAGGLWVTSFSIPHDAVDPSAFIFEVNGVKIAVMTDAGMVTMLMRQRLSGLDYLVVEANHDPDMLIAGPYPWELKQRILSREGHLSNEASVELVGSVTSGALQGITFAHLSETNNNPHILKITADKGGISVPFQIATQDTPTKIITVG